MCQGISNSSVAMSLSRVTGSGLENCLMRTMRSSILDRAGNFDARAFADVARESRMVREHGDSGILREVSGLTGMSFENAFMRINSPRIR